MAGLLLLFVRFRPGLNRRRFVEVIVGTSHVAHQVALFDLLYRRQHVRQASVGIWDDLTLTAPPDPSRPTCLICCLYLKGAAPTFLAFASYMLVRFRIGLVLKDRQPYMRFEPSLLVASYDTCIVALATVQSVGAHMIQSPASSFRQGSGPREQKTFLWPRSPELVSHMRAKLRQAGLRPTRPRVALSALLFAKGDRHVTAEKLFEEANQAKVSVSLATIYNTLHLFRAVGLLRQVAVDGSKAYFDTNNTEHHHFYIEDRHELIDVSPTDMIVGNAPMPPDGYEIVRIDVVVRLRCKNSKQA
jgi:Fur family transcriptional regulator, iron response regulator